MLPILVINLERSRERWEKIAESGKRAGLAIERVPAVEGASIPPEARPDFDPVMFRRNHGAVVLDGEYGCYRSHLSALQSIVDNGYELAVIAEDDIQLAGDLDKRVEAIFEACPQMQLLKLVNHRIKGFISYGKSALGDEFGRCIHGPQGSGACYAVTQEGARQLLRALATMVLPFDVALERGWATGVKTFTVRLPLVAFEDTSRADTTIATRKDYSGAKLPTLMRVSVLFFRAREYVSRSVYAMSGK
ncbi:glycosyl transferase family 25 [Pseudaminobacter salicylatoxidans]|uniref:Glycosyl transferase family 25 n=1 Tax=Pseudaminobacter salicylatoxidans TaxID=93369 RepID=A0A316C0R7_PSESE|nr:glycosyltransferase family 25 protein [Pseudaminobacter salicylatoxidans]PWJ81600.1 glycosyl transferase family 25 [Pseudaminobacter salicylatoxidans]